MLLSFGRPAGSTVAIANSAFVDGNAQVLINGRPGSTARFPWPSGPQTTATNIIITVTFPYAIVPRLVGAMNTTLPPGTLFTMQWKRPADGAYGYGAVTERVVQKPRGERVVWRGLSAGLDPCIGVQYVINNDVYGVASIPAGSLQDLGELWQGPGIKLIAVPEFTEKYDDPSVADLSDWMQAWSRQKTSRRILTLTPTVLQESQVYSGGMEQGYDFESLIAQIDGGQRSVIVPRHTDASGAYSAALTNRTARFGYLSQAATNKHLSGLFYGPGEWEHKEIPIPT